MTDAPERQQEMIKFRVFLMPCCGQMLCWVNPRLPNHCPECGEHVLRKLRSGEHTTIQDDGAWLTLNTGPAVMSIIRSQS